MRIDPAVVNGTRTVDVNLGGALPSGAVPELSVEGTIEIERLDDVLSWGGRCTERRIVTVGLFKIVDGGKEAVRVQVTWAAYLGRYASKFCRGCQAGDQVILSDMSAWDNFDRVQLK